MIEHMGILLAQSGKKSFVFLNGHAFQGLLGPLEKRIYSCVNYIVCRILSIL